MVGLLGPVLGIASLLALLYLSVRGGDLARVEVADGDLVVQPRGLNRLWALKGRVDVPLSQVREIRHDVPRREVPSGFRLPGTYFPGLIQAGTYRRKGEKSLWLVGRAGKVTVVECSGAAFDRIVLQLGDDKVAELREAVGGSGPRG